MRLMLFFILIFIKEIDATCPCEGIVVDGSDQEHCWQIQSRDESSWTGADDACVSVGGHLGHPDDSSFLTILSYVQETSTLPVLTGIVAGNVEIPLYAKMCQSNSLYEVITNTTDLFSNDPTYNTTCSYITNSSSELVFDSCSIDANVLCDRPLEKEDYCSIVANCSTTTTYYSTTTQSSTATPTSTLSYLSSTSSSISTGGTASSLSSSSSAPSSQSTTIATGGSNSATSASTCTCTSNDVATTTASSDTSCSQSSGCLKHQWKIFGMCIDWRALLALLAIGLLLFLCCCICHFCLNACMFCTSKTKKDVRDPILPNRSVIAPIPIASPKQQVNYDVEKSEPVVLPPTAIQPEPVVITVPEKHESVYGFHTKEIIHVMPERPSTREIGTMTDPIVTEAPVVIAPPVKRKKVVKKPKKMFIPATADPMDSIEEDVSSEVAIEIPDSPGARSVAPLGDIPEPPVPMAPLNFTRNPKPLMPPEANAPRDEIPPKRPNQSANQNPATPKQPSVGDEFDPRGLRSPPVPANNNEEAPKRMTFSPIADDSDEDTGARIPSPPRERKAAGPKSNNPRPIDNSEEKGPPEPEGARPALRNKRLNENPSPTPGGNTSGSSGPPSRSSGPASNNPFASIGGGTPGPSDQAEGGGRRPREDVGMKAARGKLGGAVRGGGGGGEAPSGWKPWAKGGARR